VIERPRRRIAGAAIAILIATVVAVGSSPVPASAADGSDFDPGFIISDDTFFNGSAMTAAQVQAFLDARVPTCRAGSGGPACLKSYTQGTPTMPADAYCSQYLGGPIETAASIITRVGQACQISQQVLIVLLEKEQGLVTSTAPSSSAYQSATGYGCPDTAACDSAYYGFFNQVYQAAHAFQWYSAHPTSFNYRAGRTNQIQYSPNAACGTKSVYIQNQATADLYIYTPYVPNDAALANLYGTGDSCSSYGNRNFFVLFTDWFGAPGNLLRSASFERGSVLGWGASNGFINQAVYNDASIAKDGSWFLATNTPVSGRALTQDVSRSAAPGQQYTATIWVRSASSTPVSGVLAVWGLGGGTTESASTTFTATASGWTSITTKLPLKAAHSVIRVDIYMLTVNQTLWTDATQMTVGPAPVERNMLDQPSFEGQFGNWIPGNGFLNRQVYQDPSTAEDGSWFAATNAPAPDRSLAQDFTVVPAAYGRYDFTIWVRSADPATPVSGTVAIWGLGGSAITSGSSGFTSTGQWTQVTASLDVGTTGVNHIRAEIYLHTANATLFIDNATLAQNVVQAGSFEGGLVTNWQRDNASGNLVTYSAASGISPAVGSYFAATNAPDATSSVYQDVKLRPVVGDTYVAEAWLRSANPGSTYRGTFAVWGLGGTTDVGFTDFTVGDTWQKVAFPVHIANDGHTVLRAQMYLKTTGQTLFMDGIQVY
jgi:hypothetical protein